MSAMQAGTQMVKLRGGSKGLVRFYFLDEHRSCIRWRPSRKNEKAKSEWGAPRAGGQQGPASRGLGLPRRPQGTGGEGQGPLAFGPRPSCPPGRAQPGADLRGRGTLSVAWERSPPASTETRPGTGRVGLLVPQAAWA